MEKHIYLFRGEPNTPIASFSEDLLSLSKELTSQPEVEGLKIVVSDPDIPTLSVIPFSKNPISAISLYGSSLAAFKELATHDCWVGTYRVEEAFPVAYKKDWPDGAITPATCLFTLFRKKQNLDWDTFIERWHNGHTPLSLKLHPLWHYSRNVVLENLSESSEPWNGIVDEYVKKRSDLLNVYRFFGNSPLFPWHMWEVYQDVKGFLDYKSTETYLAKEYVLKSL